MDRQSTEHIFFIRFKASGRRHGVKIGGVDREAALKNLREMQALWQDGASKSQTVKQEFEIEGVDYEKAD